MTSYLIVAAMVMLFGSLFIIRRTECKLVKCPVTCTCRGKKVIIILMTLLLGTFLVQSDVGNAGMSKNLIAITSEAQFETEVMKSEIPVVVDFYADWCPPCQKMLPIMSALADEWQGKIKIVKVNVDNNPKLTNKFNVEGIPDVRIIVKGKQVDKVVGYQPKANWENLFRKLTK